MAYTPLFAKLTTLETFVFSPLGGALCGHVVPLSGGRIVYGDKAERGRPPRHQPERFSLTLALEYELGHLLFVGHGDSRGSCPVTIAVTRLCGIAMRGFSRW